MQRVALLGAGGKMGVRLAQNLMSTDYHVDHVEISVKGRKRPHDKTELDCVDADNAIAAADAVNMAVPDAASGNVLHTFVEKMKPGASAIMLDAVAPYADQLPKRDDLTYFINHPCHPPINRWERTKEARMITLAGLRHRRPLFVLWSRGRRVIMLTAKLSQDDLQTSYAVAPLLSGAYGHSGTRAVRNQRRHAGNCHCRSN